MNSTVSDKRGWSPEINQTTSDPGDFGNVTCTGVALSCVTIFLSLIICTGNSLTIAAISSAPRLRTLPNMYILSLALADLLVGVLMPVLALFFLAPVKRAFDEAHLACLLLFSAMYTSCICSMLNMALIATDRYVFITRPFWYKRVVTRALAKGMVVMSWTLAVLTGSVPLYANSFRYGETCDSTRVLLFAYDGIFLSVFFFSCAAVTAVLYILVIRLAKVKQRIAPSLTPSCVSSNQTSFSNGAVPVTRELTRRQYRAIVLFISVFGIFVMCWSPRVTATIVNHYFPVSDFVYNMFSLLGLLNSGMNFLIYAFGNKDFRHAFRSMLRIRGQSDRSSGC